MKNADQPAYPLSHGVVQMCGGKTIPLGLTKREMFAMAAMQSYLNAAPQGHDEIDSEYMERIGKISVAMADELLKQLES